MPLKRLGSVALCGLLLGALSCDSNRLTDSSFDATPTVGGSIEGIVSADSRPLEGVAVELSGVVHRFTSTDTAGGFSFTSLPEGNYRIGIAGFPPWVEFVSTEETVTLLKHSQITGFEFRGTANQTAEFVGLVTVDRLALPGVRVVLSGPVSDTTVSDHEGAFSFRLLPEGLYAISISGFDPALSHFPTTEQPVVGRDGRAETIAFHGENVQQQGAPPKPTELQAIPIDSSKIALGWSNSGEPETRLERQIKPGGPWSQIKRLPNGVTNYEDGGLRPHTDYRYRIRACEGTACSGYSEEALVTTEGEGSPNLTIAAAYLTQSVQTLRGEVPLVMGRNGLFRVFPVASGSNRLRPSVRIGVYHGESLVHTETIAAPGPSVPTLVDEGDPNTSWDFEIPAALIVPGLAVVAEVDPDNEISEPDESDNSSIQPGSSSELDVRPVPPLNLVFVPVRQGLSDRVGQVSSENAGDFLDFTRKVFPIASENTSVHAEFVSSAPALESNNGNGSWGRILSEINALRVAEGSSHHYYGVVHPDYSFGIAGMSYQGWPVAVGRDDLPDRAYVAAHELGHNWNQEHAPGCGAQHPDPGFPYFTGKIGAWGTDLETREQRSPAVFYDLMSYCGPRWISDFTYERVLDSRQAQANRQSMSTPEPSLLIWGRIEQGQPVLEPAFEIITIPRLPDYPGDYVVEGLGSDGERLFSLSFDPVQLSEGGEEGHFAFALPLRSMGTGGLAHIKLAGGGSSTILRSAGPGPLMAAGATEPAVKPAPDGTLEITWESSRYPMAMVRDPSSGQILSFARDGRLRLAPPSQRIELVFSDGVRSSEVIRRTWQ